MAALHGHFNGMRVHATLRASMSTGSTPHSILPRCPLSSPRARFFAPPLPPAPRPSTSPITCMAHPRRVARVAKQIEREVGSLLITDKVLQQAICPERRRGMDGALSALASVIDVQVSNDLQVAKVFLSIYSDDAGKAAAITGLQRLEGYVRKHIGRTIRLRLTPEIRFIMDESIERSERVFKLLAQVKAIEAGEAPPPPISIGNSTGDDGNGGGVGGGYGYAFEPSTIVDLGIFEGEEEGEEEDDEEEEEKDDAVDDGKYDMTNEEVEEMMALFRQESAAGRGGGSGGARGRGRKTGGGGRGGGQRISRKK